MQYGSVEVLKCGSVEVWKCGSVLSGSMQCSVFIVAMHSWAIFSKAMCSVTMSSVKCCNEQCGNVPRRSMKYAVCSI